MDNGLDIETLACIAVAQAALGGALDALARYLPSALQQAASGVSVARRRATLTHYLAQHGVAPQWQLAEPLARWLSEGANALRVLGAPGYPSQLAAIPKPPPVLFVRGNPALLAEIQIAVVGSRRATVAGRETAFGLARDLAQAGIVITSGLASGIDAAAHRGALAANGGTIAVFGCGIDRIYPAAHWSLAEAVAATGALVSEFPLGTPPTRYSFPRRNRIISGLARGTLVVEAALTSGSLITAQQALEQGRDVYAVPGPIRSPLSQGCHWLIKQGAALTENAQDVLGELFGLVLTSHAASPTHNPAAVLSGPERLVLEACEFEPVLFSALVERCGLTTPEVSSILTRLDLKGLVRSATGGLFVRIGNPPA
ncbi:MAG: DNA-protecting protein DprA [Gammaproteobacteria bacterium]|nr:DNA-protecting protein DprA [Gammaproteobacteria bacterium]